MYEMFHRSVKCSRSLILEPVSCKTQSRRLLWHSLVTLFRKLLWQALSLVTLLKVAVTGPVIGHIIKGCWDRPCHWSHYSECCCDRTWDWSHYCLLISVLSPDCLHGLHQTLSMTWLNIHPHFTANLFIFLYKKTHQSGWEVSNIFSVVTMSMHQGQWNRAPCWLVVC